MLKTTFATMAFLLATSSLSMAAIPPMDEIRTAQLELQDFDREAKRSKQRLPNGSGSDSARDRAEHAECCGASKSAIEEGQDQPIQEAKRRKKRVPGGSGCDSAHDRAEHPECRG